MRSGIGGCRSLFLIPSASIGLRALESRTALQPELPEHNCDRTEAGERGLKHVHAGEGRQKQPIRMNKPGKSKAEQHDTAGESKDRTIDVHEADSCWRAVSMAECPRPAGSVLTTYSYIRIYASMKREIAPLFVAADAACELMKALANRHRLTILCQLNEKERSVSDLAELLKIRVSTVSQHLALLRRDGLVTAQRDGQTIWYSIGSTPARELINTLYRIYCEPSAGCPATGVQKHVRPVRRRSPARNHRSRREIA